MKVDERTQKSQAGILKLYKLLSDIKTNPQDFNGQAKELFMALKSQGGICGYANEKLGIEKQSVNRVKRNARVIDGGWEAFNKLRKEAYKQLDKEINKNNTKVNKTGTKAYEREKKELARIQLRTAREDLLLITMMLQESMTQARNYAEESGSNLIIERCRLEQSEILFKLSASSMGMVTLTKLQELLDKLKKSDENG